MDGYTISDKWLFKSSFEYLELGDYGLNQHRTLKRSLKINIQYCRFCISTKILYGILRLDPALFTSRKSTNANGGNYYKPIKNCDSTVEITGLTPCQASYAFVMNVDR